MNDIVLNLITLAGFLIIAGSFFSIYRKKQKQQQQALLDMANQKGWQIKFIKENLAKGFLLETPEWTLESIARTSGVESGPGSSDIEQTTKWFCHQTGSPFMIGPKHSQMPVSSTIAPFIKQMMVNELGKEANQIHEVKIGSPSFQAQFMVWASNENDVENILTSTMQSAMLTWTKVPPLIKRTSSGTTIELKGIALKKTIEIESLVKLGEKFL